MKATVIITELGPPRPLDHPEMEVQITARAATQNEAIAFGNRVMAMIAGRRPVKVIQPMDLEGDEAVVRFTIPEKMKEIA